MAIDSYNRPVVKVLIAGSFLITTLFIHQLYFTIQKQLPKFEVGNATDSYKWIFDSNLSQDDPKLVQFTFNNFLKPPSKLQYNLRDPKGDPAKNEKQNLFALKLLKGKKGGFFIECGANDGEFLSSTVVLERDYQWTGLLIEPDPDLYPILLTKHRKAWSANTCLSTKPYPTNVTFVHSHEDGWSGLSAYDINSRRQVRLKGPQDHLSTVTCLPLFTILSALSIKDIDFFALDVEGSELKILKTIPFESVNIKVFTIEYPHIPEGSQALKDFMTSKGFTFVPRRQHGYAPDYSFVHNSLKENIKLGLEADTTDDN